MSGSFLVAVSRSKIMEGVKEESKRSLIYVDETVSSISFGMYLTSYDTRECAL